MRGLNAITRYPDQLRRRFAEEPSLTNSKVFQAVQVGVTPEGIETPRCIVDPSSASSVSQQPLEHRATLPTGPDPKWRYFWRIGDRPAETEFAELNAEPVVPAGEKGYQPQPPAACHPNRMESQSLPAGFPDWVEVMDGWGAKMLAALRTTSELVALGFGLPMDAFTKLMHNGPHLLGPTGKPPFVHGCLLLEQSLTSMLNSADVDRHNAGIDLGRHLESVKAFAGFHYDLNLMVRPQCPRCLVPDCQTVSAYLCRAQIATHHLQTIHGKSRFPGLYIWLADGRRVPVRIPTGCLLLQAGKQLEWLTAGCVKAGMHEVHSRLIHMTHHMDETAAHQYLSHASVTFGF